MCYCEPVAPGFYSPPSIQQHIICLHLKAGRIGKAEVSNRSVGAKSWAAAIDFCTSVESELSIFVSALIKMSPEGRGHWDILQHFTACLANCKGACSRSLGGVQVLGRVLPDQWNLMALWSGVKSDFTPKTSRRMRHGMFGTCVGLVGLSTIAGFLKDTHH